VEPGAVFAGVPTFVKGVSALAGLPNRLGSRAVPATPAAATSPEVEQFLSTGLVNLGLSTTPEFGLVATTEPALTGATRNPWSLEHSTGGSSGGAAALVASGVVPIAHGSDGGGSIRIPAACCGIVGLKPSRGRMAAPPLPKIIPIDAGANGVVSRTVRDTAAFMSAAEQHRPADGLPPIGHVTRPDARRLRIGMITGRDDGTAFDSRNTAETLRIAELLDDLGHEVEAIPSPFPTNLTEDFLIFWSYNAFLLWHSGNTTFGDGWDRDQLEPFTQWLVPYFRRRAAKAPVAFRRLRRFCHTYSEAYSRHDVLLAPTLAGPTHRLGYLATDLPGELHLTRSLHQVATTAAHNAGGGPAISLPLATDAGGLPMGIQFAADIGQEATLLALAIELEDAHPWPTLASAPA
jgi:amidase